MELKRITQQDREIWMRINPYAAPSAFDMHVLDGTGYILFENAEAIGVMHHCLIWDTLPFLNLLYIAKEYRARGFGSQAMAQWETCMKKQGCNLVLISTQADEDAQHFYRKLGYIDCGGFVPGDREPMELIMRKAL